MIDRKGEVPPAAASLDGEIELDGQRCAVLAGDLNVLVIEDNPVNLLLAETVLIRAGFRVTSAASAEEGLSILSSLRPAIILTDIQLPGMGGIELVRHLRADPALAAIPIVALTAHAMPEEEEGARAAGCDGFIRKPFDTRLLADQVRSYLGKPG